MLSEGALFLGTKTRDSATSKMSDFIATPSMLYLHIAMHSDMSNSDQLEKPSRDP